MDIKESARIKCKCGKEHKTSLQEVIIEENAIERIPEIFDKYHYQKAFFVSDINTQAVAGEKISKILEKKHKKFSQYIFEEKALVPDEEMLGKLLVAIDKECDVLVGIGSGTINDICKFVSFQLKLDYFIVATAPSMDGFASNVAPLITNHLKTTYEVNVPKGIIGDLSILKEAPLPMIAAGIGDILGKYICLLDWKISHLLKGEYYCEYVEDLVRSSIEIVVKQVQTTKIRERKPEMIKAIMEALVLSGIAMSYVGNSRPASGSEHHLSHYWEMTFLFQHRPAVLHGTKVAIGTVATTKIYSWLKEKKPDFKKAREKAKKFSLEEWEKNIGDVYGSAAKEVISFEHKINKNNPNNVIKRLKLMEEKWEEIVYLIEEKLPDVEFIIHLLKQIEAPWNPKQIKIDYEIVKNSIYYAKELRDRFGLLQILFDLDLQEDMAQNLIEFFQLTRQKYEPEYEPWINWAKELQFIAQVGLTYTNGKYDEERYTRIREISAEILSMKTSLSLEKVKQLFCNETGFQTPKIDSRAAIFKENKILLVREIQDKTWSLPGGWIDVNQSIRSNLIKETKEEAGLDIEPERLIAILDRNKYNSPPSPYGIFKVFVLCSEIGGEFVSNIETDASGFFSLDELPCLSVGRNTKQQIEMCFAAKEQPDWKVIFD